MTRRICFILLLACASVPLGCKSQQTCENAKTEDAPAAKSIFTDARLKEAGLAVAWKRDLNCGAVRKVYLDAQNVYVETVSGILHCLNAKTGIQRWQQALQWQLAFPPILMGDRVGYEVRGNLRVFDLRDGRQLFHRRLHADAAVAAPVYRNGFLYIPLVTSRVAKIDVKTGEDVWGVKMAKHLGTLWAKPACVGNFVVYVSRDSGGSVHCVDDATGNPVWDYAVGADLMAPVVAGSWVFVASADGNLYAFDTAAMPRGQKPKPTWVATTAGPLFDLPQVAGDTVAVPCRTRGLYAFSRKSGQQQWLLSDTVGHVAAWTQARAYIHTQDGLLSVVDAKTGKRIYELEPAKFTRSLPNTSSTLYLASDDGQLLALKEKD